jgi:hypothetical protein
MRRLLALFCLVPLITGCGSSNKSNDWDKGPSAAALSEEFKKDAKAADQKYKDKSVSFAGKVAAVMSKDETGKDHVILIFEGLRKEKAEDDGPDIECALVADATSKAMGLIETQKVKITGKYKSYGKNPEQPEQLRDQIYLTDVKIDDVGPDPTVPVSAAELARTFATDPAAAKAKYIGKMVVVDGKFVTTKFIQNIGSVTIIEGHKDGDKAFDLVLLGDADKIGNPAQFETVKFRAMCDGQVNVDGTPCVRLWGPKLVK